MLGKLRVWMKWDMTFKFEVVSYTSGCKSVICYLFFIYSSFEVVSYTLHDMMQVLKLKQESLLSVILVLKLICISHRSLFVSNAFVLSFWN